MKTSIPYS